MSADDVTPEQRAHLDAIANKWIAIGRSCGETDKVACESAVMLAYEVAKLPPPADEEGNTFIVWVSDPKAGMELASKYVILDKHLEKLGHNWSDNKPEAVKHLDLRRQVDEAYRLLELPIPTREQRNEQRQTACYGQHDVYWCAFYEAMEYLKPDALGRDAETGKCVLDGLIAMAQCGWWWPFNHGVILCERPIEAHFDEQGRLSNRTGPALRFPSGYSMWLIDGVQLHNARHWGDGGEYGRRIIEGEVTAQEVLAENNSEVRRLMTEVYGEAKLIADLGAEPIHVDEWGTLFRIDMPGDEPLMMVRVLDSTPKPDGEYEIYWLRIHPELRPLLEDVDGQPRFGEPQALTALNAIASTAGMRGEEYRSVAQQT